MDIISFKVEKEVNILKYKYNIIQSPFDVVLYTIGYNNYINYNEYYGIEQRKDIKPQIEKEYHIPVLYLNLKIIKKELDLKEDIAIELYEIIKFYKINNILDLDKNIKFKNNIKEKTTTYFDLNVFKNDFSTYNALPLNNVLYKNLFKKYNQKDNLIIRFLNLSSLFTLKFLCILSNIFNEIYIHKPLSTLHTNIKYIICLNFKKEFSEKKLEISKDLFVIDMYEEYNVLELFKEQIKKININLNNLKFKTINEIYHYIVNNNYFGEDYNKYLKRQEENTNNFLKMLQ